MNWPIFLYFIIGHFLGDFVFQTNKIVAWKTKAFWGLLPHVSLVYLATLILFIPYLNHLSIWLICSINAILHFGIDRFKIVNEKYYHEIHPQTTRNPLPPYLFDQLAHLIVIAILSWFIPNNLNITLFESNNWIHFYQRTDLLLYILGIILFSYTSDITYFMYQLSKKPVQYSRSYYAMMKRLVIFALAFLVIWILVRLVWQIF
ncbi:MAG TPA: DUF3307 domain-containing protein [Candidatus Gracilibacteria bacterium]|nr:DUF3307 domain-containing protein [Candidatus Gracilibacteria bacterium]